MVNLDVIVVCVGEKREEFGENNNRSNIKLDDRQEELIAKLKKQGKPVSSFQWPTAGY